MNIKIKEAFSYSDKLNTLNKSELTNLIRYFFEEASVNQIEELTLYAGALQNYYYGDHIYFRGLIEFSNYCKNNCLYCGIQKSNRNVHRYRMTKKEILDCCQTGYDLGFRTFVMQSGEDPYFTDERLSDIVKEIKRRHPDCAITLSVGERSYESYKRLFDAGADRYLLRHETANEAHYDKLHPSKLSLETRKQCLRDLEEIGYQVGSGFMLESPFQTYSSLAEDLIFLRELQPHMIGIGPFIPHKDTVFSGLPTPSSEKTLIMLSLIRILLPKVLLPATTALGTVDPLGREKAFKAGANVVMPNLSPVQYREDYSLYDNKICTGEEAAECLSCLSNRIRSAGYTPDFSRGDHIDRQKESPRYANRT